MEEVRKAGSRLSLPCCQLPMSHGKHSLRDPLVAHF